MSKRIFTKEQIEILLQNPNVARCSEKSISYRREFKVLAIRKYQEEGLPPHEIFRQARFDIDMIGRENPRYCIRRWRKIFRQKGEVGLMRDSRGVLASGRHKSITHLTDKEKMERLEAEVYYLREENRFLAKLRKERLNYGHIKNIKPSDR